MNVPGQPTGNWRWRLLPGQLGEAQVEALAEVTATFERGPAAARAER